ncbi:hypothetical protein Peur_069079 [Populus x canadensis]
MARFSKALRKTDIKKRLSVPTGFLSSLPSFNAGGHAVDFQAVDGSGRVWAFRCSIRKKGHPKPVISKGWLAFVHSKSLKVDDRGEDAPSRQKKNERRVPRRRKTTTEAAAPSQINKRVSHRLGGGQSVNSTLNQHHHQQNQMVCHHRRAGKCNRFPCPSLHRELPAPPPHSSVNGGGGGGGAKRGFIGNDSSINPSPVSSPFLSNSRFLLHLKGN